MIFNYHYMYSLIDNRYTLSRGRLLCRVFHIFRRERNILCFVPNAAPPLQKAAKNAPSNTMTALFSIPTAVKGYLPPRQKFLAKRPAHRLYRHCFADRRRLGTRALAGQKPKGRHRAEQIRSCASRISEYPYDRRLDHFVRLDNADEPKLSLYRRDREKHQLQRCSLL